MNNSLKFALGFMAGLTIYVIVIFGLHSLLHSSPLIPRFLHCLAWIYSYVIMFTLALPAVPRMFWRFNAGPRALRPSGTIFPLPVIVRKFLSTLEAKSSGEPHLFQGIDFGLTTALIGSLTLALYGFIWGQEWMAHHIIN